MGYWGTGLYSNDCTCDVRDSYLDYLKKGISNDEAYEKTMIDYAEYMGTEEEPLFWYALADTQWKTGRLDQFVKQKALNWITSEGGLSLWSEKPTYAKKWKKVLEDLSIKLNSPQRPEKKIRDTTVIQYNPGNVGDVFAYRFHTKAAEENGYLGKWILMQKIGEIPGVFWGDQMIPHMVVFDMLFDKAPVEVDISDIRLIPFSVAETFMPTGRNSCFPMLDLHASFPLHRKSHSPQKYMKFIGNFNIPQGIHQSYFKQYGANMAWDRIEEIIIAFHSQWKDYSYQLYPKESIVSKKEK